MNCRNYEDSHGQVIKNSLDIPHVMQEDSFDCGLACVCMILRGLGQHDITVANMHEAVSMSTSIWTIDLAFLLRSYAPDLDFTLYTSFTGARTQHRTTFDEDEQRVNHLFDIAQDSRVKTVRMILSLDDFRKLLRSSSFTIIALVNSRLIRCRLCQQHQLCYQPLLEVFNSFLEFWNGNGYAGHFIVLVSFDPKTDSFIYRDPGVIDEDCMITARNFEVARRSPGTDEDCIVIKLL
ncbi:9330_t:CDS:2 [Paraglomus occultum]|uniref:9330_t:CDS:1 n=1 Tax=Paraglomus occultum TaxID=144539 RepID=A0A9N8W772_9GLOM|nr:9330_t:CDS:2 [Paraglomus occultum]